MNVQLPLQLSGWATERVKWSPHTQTDSMMTFDMSVSSLLQNEVVIPSNCRIRMVVIASRETKMLSDQTDVEPSPPQPSKTSLLSSPTTMSTLDLETLLTSPKLISLLEASKTTQSQLLTLLSAPTAAPATTRVQQQSTLLSQLSHLRTLHRQTVLTLRATKSETASARSDVDSLHLTFQNLIYEQSHLRAEIEACERYPHPYADLPLEDLDTFLTSHAELESAGDHELTLARIEYERLQREGLEKQRLGLVRKKQALVKENLKREEDLQGLDGRMEAFIDAARPIEQVLGLVKDEDVKEKNVEEGTTVATGSAAAGKHVTMG